MNTSVHIKQLNGQVKAIFLFCDKWSRHTINLLSTVILKMKLKEMLVQVREETIRLEEQQQKKSIRKSKNFRSGQTNNAQLYSNRIIFIAYEK